MRNNTHKDPASSLIKLIVKCGFEWVFTIGYNILSHRIKLPLLVTAWDIGEQGLWMPCRETEGQTEEGATCSVPSLQLTLWTVIDGEIGQNHYSSGILSHINLRLVEKVFFNSRVSSSICFYFHFSLSNNAIYICVILASNVYSLFL